MLFFTSDTHFNHNNIIKYSERPFAHVTEMNEHMIAAWNSVVTNNDIVYHLGDVFYPSQNAHHISLDELMSRLNGTKRLILGNHDIDKTHGTHESNPVPSHWGWDSVESYAEVKFGKTRFVLSHYPFETWRNAHHGWYHLHGHCHGTLKRKLAHRFDVGVDSHKDYRPFSAEELREIFKTQDNYEPQDHHGDVKDVIKY